MSLFFLSSFFLLFVTSSSSSSSPSSSPPLLHSSPLTPQNQPAQRRRRLSNSSAQHAKARVPDFLPCQALHWHLTAGFLFFVCVRIESAPAQRAQAYPRRLCTFFRPAGEKHKPVAIGGGDWLRYLPKVQKRRRLAKLFGSLAASASPGVIAGAKSFLAARAAKRCHSSRFEVRVRVGCVPYLMCCTKYRMYTMGGRVYMYL